MNQSGAPAATGAGTVVGLECVRAEGAEEGRRQAMAYAAEVPKALLEAKAEEAAQVAGAPAGLETPPWRWPPRRSWVS